MKKFGKVAVLTVAAVAMTAAFSGSAFAVEYEMVECGSSETRECAPADLEATKASFAGEILFDKDGIAGMIPLADISEKACYETVTYECNRTATWSGLPTNDASQIPATADFTDDQGRSVTLQMAGLSWEVGGTDERGVPNSYTATAIYRGMVSYDELTHYQVTATYKGELQGKAIEEPAPVPQPAPEPEPEKGFPVGAAVAVAAAVLAAACFIPVIRRSNMAKFVHVSVDAGNRMQRKVVGAKKVTADGLRLSCDAGDIELDVLGLTNYCAVELPRKYVGGGRTLALTQHGNTVYCGPAEASIKVLSPK